MDSATLARELQEIRALRTKHSKSHKHQVLERCLAFAHDEFPQTDDVQWHELAVHQAWALTQPDMNIHRVMGLLTYVMDNTPLDTVTTPYVAAMCMRAALFHLQGNTELAETTFEHVFARIKDAADPVYLGLYYATFEALGISPPS